MIGLSLSFCVKDIILGNVLEKDVKQIIAGTACQSEEDWDHVILGYQQTYWCNDPETAEALVRRLMAQCKIDQPRLRGESVPNIADGWWRE